MLSRILERNMMLQNTSREPMSMPMDYTIAELTAVQAADQITPADPFGYAVAQLLATTVEIGRLENCAAQHGKTLEDIPYLDGHAMELTGRTLYRLRDEGVLDGMQGPQVDAFLEDAATTAEHLFVTVQRQPQQPFDLPTALSAYLPPLAGLA
jgi:hypothetical protein